MEELITIEKIEKIEPLDGSKTLEVLHLENNGWKAIGTKGKFLQNGLCVLVRSGTFFLDLKSAVHSDLVFIRETYQSHVRTLKFKNIISNGYAMNLDVLPDEVKHNIFVGRDVTQEFKAVAWERDKSMLHNISKGPMPTWIPAGKDKLLQSNRRTLVPLSSTEFYGVEKFDGMNVIFYYTTGVGGRDTFGICSRNIEFLLTANHPVIEWAKKNNIREKLKIICQSSGLFELEGPYPSIWLQGDFISETINRNYYRTQGSECYFHTLGAHPFKENIVNRKLFEKLLRENSLKSSPIIRESVYLTDQTYGNKLKSVLRRLPKIGYKVKAPRINFDSLVEKATFKSSFNPKKEAKGLILKPKNRFNSDFLIEELGKTFLIQNPEFNLRNNL